MEQKLKDKLLKLYELAKRGVDGEKVSADIMLNKMLEKHGLTLDDIDAELPRKRYYKYPNKLIQTLVVQIICKVTNRGDIYGVKGIKEIQSEVTDYEHVQILELIDFHLENFDKERRRVLDDFKKAYVQKHELYREYTERSDSKNDPTPKDIEDRIRQNNLRNNLSDKSYQKKLS